MKLKTIKDIENLLNKLPHVLKVNFALKEVLRIEHLLTKEAKHCVELVSSWLKDPTSVSDQQLLDAAASAASAAAHAAYAAAYAANAADYKQRDKLIDESYYRLVGMINPLHKLFWELDVQQT